MPFQTKTLITMVLLAVIGVMAFVAAARTRANHADVVVTSEQSPTSLPRGRVQVVRFTLYDVAILPQQATVEKGFVTFVVEDLSGGTTGLVIERDVGQGREVIGQVRRRERSRYGREELQLEPGSYQLYMADRPDNRAEIIVEP